MNLFKVILALFLFNLTVSTFAQVPRNINYQAKLTDSEGIAINDTDRVIAFQLFEDETGGTVLWAETLSVNLVKGLFDVRLGEANPLNLDFDRQYWIELKVDENDDGDVTDLTDEILFPREKLSSVSYSFRAIHATHADSVIQSVSSDVNPLGRRGHIRYIPYEGSSVMESGTSDTIYIAIGGGGSLSTTPGPRVRRLRMTSTTHTGNMGGYSGVNDICRSEFGNGWHMCNSREYWRAEGSDYLDVTGVPYAFDYEYITFDADAWIAPYVGSSGSVNTRDCSHWTSTSGSAYTARIQSINANASCYGTYMTSSTSCSTPNYIWCCED